jgi:hypothetical protein
MNNNLEGYLESKTNNKLTYIELCKTKVFQFFKKTPIYTEVYDNSDLSSNQTCSTQTESNKGNENEFNLEYILHFWQIFKNTNMDYKNMLNYLGIELNNFQVNSEITFYYNKFPIIKNLFESQLKSNKDYLIVFTSKSSDEIIIHCYFPELWTKILGENALYSSQNNLEIFNLTRYITFKLCYPEVNFALKENVCSVLCYTEF